MRKLYELIKWFCYITPGIVFVCAVNAALAGETAIPVTNLWQILLSALLTALVTTLLLPKEWDHKLTVCAGILLHYAALSIVMISFGCWFGWMRLDAAGILMMLISVAAVYMFVLLTYFLIDIRQADKINQKLKEKYGGHK